MIIKNKELKKMLKEQGRSYVLMLYTNRFIHMTNRQLDYVLKYGGKHGTFRNNTTMENKMR